MDIFKLKSFLKEKNLPEYRLKQILQAVFQQAVGDWEEIETLPQSFRQDLKREIPLLSFAVNKILVSKDKRALKALLELEDGLKIETVLLNPKSGLWSTCVSTQVGCAMNCLFCATGMMGFKRNLSTEEITDQVLFWKQYLRKENSSAKLTHVVYMGMGEPLANKEHVFESLRILMDPNYFAIGQRNLSVSTSGFVPGIVGLARNFPQVNLAISLHAPTDKLRSELMPMNEKYPLNNLISELGKYFKISNRKVFLEYILLAGINDKEIHARELATLIKKTRYKRLLHVNLIAYNQTSYSHRAPTREIVHRFKNSLKNLGIQVTIRKSLGQDIMAACGQLATS